MSKPYNLRDINNCEYCIHGKNLAGYEELENWWCEKYDFRLGWDSGMVCNSYKEKR